MASELVRLDVGGQHSFTVLGDSKWNMSGVKVGKGERYDLTVSEVNGWRDASVISTPEGQVEVPWILRTNVARKFRRFDGAEWYALVGCVRGKRDWMFKIGNGSAIEIEENGEFAAFTNDASLMYWNNHGSLKLGIERRG